MSTSPRRDLASLQRAETKVPLRTATSEAWTHLALTHVDQLLDDHTQCELKAASNALAIVGRNPGKDELVGNLMGLAREEMQHYRQVRQELIGRGGEPTRPLPSPYLKGVSADRLGSPYNLLDDLVVGALVEARSCERFVSLAHGLERGLVDVSDGKDLGAFYGNLARSESGHATLFLDLARLYFPTELVDRELERRLDLEARVLDSIAMTPRMHGGNN